MYNLALSQTSYNSLILMEENQKNTKFSLVTELLSHLQKLHFLTGAIFIIARQL